MLYFYDSILTKAMTGMVFNMSIGSKISFLAFEVRYMLFGSCFYISFRQHITIGQSSEKSL